MSVEPTRNNTWDCVPCEQTYFAFKGSQPPYTCDFCGGELRQRKPGAEPYEPGSYEGDASLPENIAALPLFATEAARA